MEEQEGMGTEKETDHAEKEGEKGRRNSNDREKEHGKEGSGMWKRGQREKGHEKGKEEKKEKMWSSGSISREQATHTITDTNMNSNNAGGTDASTTRQQSHFLPHIEQRTAIAASLDTTKPSCDHPSPTSAGGADTTTSGPHIAVSVPFMRAGRSFTSSAVPSAVQPLSSEYMESLNVLKSVLHELPLCNFALTKRSFRARLLFYHICLILFHPAI